MALYFIQGGSAAQAGTELAMTGVSLREAQRRSNLRDLQETGRKAVCDDEPDATSLQDPDGQPSHPELSRMGEGRGAADRLCPRLHFERDGIQRACPAPAGPLPDPRPRCPRPWEERLVAHR